MDNAHGDVFRVPRVQEARAAGELLLLRVPFSSEVGQFAQGLCAFIPNSLCGSVARSPYVRRFRASETPLP